MEKKTSFPNMAPKRKRCLLQYDKERRWELGYLKKTCVDLGLENGFRRHQMHLMLRYLRTYFYLMSAFCVFNVLTIAFFANNLIYFPADCVFDFGTTIGLMLLLGINFNVEFVMRHQWVSTVSSVLATLFVVFMDVAMTFYSQQVNKWDLNAHHDTIMMCAIYMFLPLTSINVAISLSFVVTSVYLFLFTCVHRPTYHYSDFGVNILTYIALNLLGIYYRLVSTTLQRSSFLDLHQFYVEDSWLRNARCQESLLLNAIIPPLIAANVQQNILEVLAENKKGISMSHSAAFARTKGIMAIQSHPDVSILYADVVNYTYLTTTLAVEELVLLLDDLYSKFDNSAAMLNVQRIKFLGDCYYCVSGLDKPNPDHAENAVAMAFAMIADIVTVGKDRNIDLEMRIGVHSGAIYAGIIGISKLQFDIWGPDVDIANHLEMTGKSGFVHVSYKTLLLLDPSEYIILPGTEKAKNDPVLNMATFLIMGDHHPLEMRVHKTNAHLRDSKIYEFTPPPRGGSTRLDDVDISDVIVEKFDQILNVRGGCTQHCGRKSVNFRAPLNTLLTKLKDSDLEHDFIRRPDYALKYSIMLGWLIGCFLIMIQLSVVNSDSAVCVVVDLLTFVYLTTLLAISWYKKYCFWKFGSNPNRQYNALSCRIFKIWEEIQDNLSDRVAIYLSIAVSNMAIISIILGFCDADKFHIFVIEDQMYKYEATMDTCFEPWAYTDTITLIIGICFTFSNIPFTVKVAISVLKAITCIIIIFFEYGFIFNYSLSTAPFLPAGIAHAQRLIISLITFYMKERQAEAIARANYKMYVDLKKKQDAADLANASIDLLLHNILPAHVVELYTLNLANHELYYENYDLVSVMFATLLNFRIDIKGLGVLNEVICEFDKLLNVYREYHIVEKIKVVNCTYMAACGLEYARNSLLKNSLSKSLKTSLLFQADFYRANLVEVNDDEAESVFVMTTFALDLMRILFLCKEAYSASPFDQSLSLGEICIGISSGEVMAGVVGASKPHYDIWGNAVNLASRMQSTGLPGHIQVTEESANFLHNYGISTTYRGMTFVKGVGEIPTYFVDIDNDFHFVYLPRSSENSSSWKDESSQ